MPHIKGKATKDKGIKKPATQPKPKALKLGHDGQFSNFDKVLDRLYGKKGDGSNLAD